MTMVHFSLLFQLFGSPWCFRVRVHFHFFVEIWLVPTSASRNQAGFRRRNPVGNFWLKFDCHQRWQTKQNNNMTCKEAFSCKDESPKHRESHSTIKTIKYTWKGGVHFMHSFFLMLGKMADAKRKFFFFSTKNSKMHMVMLT
jgi:hypothetical protein